MPSPPPIDPGPEHELLEGSPFYIHTPTAEVDARTLALKCGDTFIVVDRRGDIVPGPQALGGLYHGGTRYLSAFELRFGSERPLFLSSAVREDNACIVVDLANVDVTEGDVISIPRGTLHLARTLLLWDGALHQRVSLRNYGLTPVTVPLVCSFGADYHDIFEVRGTRRTRCGETLPAASDRTGVTLGYRGLDQRIRRTRIAFARAPSRLTSSGAIFECVLPPQSEQTFLISISCDEDAPRPVVAFQAAAEAAAGALRQTRAESCEIVTSNQQFNEWIERSAADLAMMITPTPDGPYPYAGVPWFSTPFGRDGLITALEGLWMTPSLAQGVLSFLAATQATAVEPDRDAQPGKILHEMRSGEMAALGEIPFGRYYGSHDATPLFVVLASEYYGRTGDLAFIRRLWPAITAALHWIARDGDPDGDGFIEYARESPTGLVHQGWKDSHDAVHYSDGRLAEPPIALCEIQGYVFAAWQGAARLAARLGQPDRAAEWSARAADVRRRFEAAFWNDELGTYVLALDGAKQQCAVRSSNAGQVLWSGIASPERAALVARQLMAAESFSGWGIRTLATSEVRFNPMSYHNGSVWPHDNALIAAGLRRYGQRREALQVLSGLFDASVSMDLHRLPELFCGLVRRSGERPTLYPVACNPQAWAAASVFSLLQSALGLEIDGPHASLRLTRALLPPFLDEVVIRRLRVGNARLDLRLERQEHDVGISVLRRDGEVEVVAIK
jgi:glycogen debranching enzyme